MTRSDRFAGRVFTGAGIYGLLVLLPQYLVESGIGPALPGPIQRPSDFYGFIGLAVAWQFVFLVIARDVRRYRPLMLASVVEKLIFGIPVLLLYIAGRVSGVVLAFGVVDLALGVLFVVAFRSIGAASEVKLDS